VKVAVPALLLLLGACVIPRGIGGVPKEAVQAHGDLQVWREFVELLQSGPLPSERVAPYVENLREPSAGWKLDIAYEGSDCVFRFRKPPQ